MDSVGVHGFQMVSSTHMWGPAGEEVSFLLISLRGALGAAHGPTHLLRAEPAVGILGVWSNIKLGLVQGECQPQTWHMALLLGHSVHL